MVQILLNSCTTVTVESFHGYGEEMAVKEMLEALKTVDMPELRKFVSGNNSRVEEQLEEQLYFARELVSSIQNTVQRLGEKPLREPAREALQGILRMIDDSMFEL